jgi:hypothetical protein
VNNEKNDFTGWLSLQQQFIFFQFVFLLLKRYDRAGAHRQ